jgi:capsular exopolysaccharide synthesis family protein
LTERSHGAPGTEDFRQYVAVLRRRKWSIALVTIVTVGAALFFSFRQTPIYHSTAQVFVRPVTTANQAPRYVNMDNEQVLASSTGVAQIVQTKLRDQGEVSPPSADQLRSSLDVAVAGSAEALTIGYSDPDPVRAQQLASDFATAYLDFRTRDALGEIQTGINGVNERIAAIRTELTHISTQIDKTRDQDELTSLRREQNDLLVEQVNLSGQLQDLKLQQSTLGQGGQVTVPANLPSSPASPKHVENGLLALVAGLALGIGLAFLRERLDDHLRSREDLEDQLRAPTLAVVPTFKGRRKKRDPLPTLATPKAPSSEAYRTIRTNLQYFGRDGGLTVVAVTSPSSGEGKTTTVGNLAVTMALAGKRVVAVSCDLRKPAMHRLFRLSNDVGLSSFLTGQASLSDAAKRCGIQNLRVMPSGPVPPNPAELLGSAAMESLLENLRRQADIVLLDTPPVFAVSDALALAPLSDGVVVIVDSRTTTKGAAAHVYEQLSHVGGRILGGVLNNFNPSEAKYYPTYYRYYYTYEYRDAGLEEHAVNNGNGNGGRKRSEKSGVNEPIVPLRAGSAPTNGHGNGHDTSPLAGEKVQPQDIWR